MPGSESTDMAAETTQLYENDETFPPLIMIVTLPEDRTVESTGFCDEWLVLESRVIEAEPSARLVSWATSGDPAFVSDDGRTTFGHIYLVIDGCEPRELAEIQESMAGATISDAPVSRPGSSSTPL